MPEPKKQPRGWPAAVGSAVAVAAFVVTLHLSLFQPAAVAMAVDVTRREIRDSLHEHNMQPHADAVSMEVLNHILTSLRDQHADLKNRLNRIETKVDTIRSK